MSATASTSMRAPGIARRLTSTSVLAGRVLAEDLLPHGIHRLPVVDVGQEHRHLHDVGEARAGRREHRADVLEHLSGLRDDVAGHEVPVAVDRDAARDEEQIAGAHGIGVVADRLGEARDADLARAAHAPPLGSRVSVVRGVIASGSMRSVITAGTPASSARSSAPANSLRRARPSRRARRTRARTPRSRG